MAKLDLQIPQPVLPVPTIPFVATVAVSGARPNANVHISLKQTQGAPQTTFWTGGQSLAVDSEGAGTAVFNGVVIAGNPGAMEVVTFVANATDDVGDYFWADAKSAVT